SEPCQAEIGKVRFTFCIYQNVSWLNVSMENTALVRVMQSAGEPGNQFHCTPDRQKLAPNELVKRGAFDQFHAEVARPITLANFVDRNNVRIIQTRRSFRFQAESLAAVLLGPMAFNENLECDCAIETFLSRSIDNALTSAADFFQQFVVAQTPGRAGLIGCPVPLSGDISVDAPGFVRLRRVVYVCK